MSDPVIINWDYASGDDELEVVRWYLAARLDLQTKLESRLGISACAYEYLRHAIKLPMIEVPRLGKALQIPMENIGACQWIWPDRETGRWLAIPEFPQLPFAKLSLNSRRTVLEFLDAQYPAVSDIDIAEFADWGVSETLSELAKVSEHSKERVIAQAEVFARTCVIPITIDFGRSLKEAERSAVDLIRQYRDRFADGRSLAGRRAVNNPCAALKDLAVARLLYLHSFDIQQASKWARKFQPRDSDGRLIPWFNKRGGRGKAFSGVFKDPRDWMLAVRRFGKKLQGFACSQ